MTRPLGVIICVAILFIGISCSSGSNGTGTGGIITASSGCKSQTQGKAGIGLQAADTYQADRTYVQYEFENNNLFLKHINAWFNCCPTSISAVASVVDGTISIEEKEDLSRSACKCLCRYDLDMKVDNVEAVQYTIRIITPQVAQPIEFNIYLERQTSGVFEVV